MFKVLPSLRQKGNEEAHKAEMEKALSISKEGFDRLHKLSKDYAFNYKIFVLYPETEINQDLYEGIHKQLQEIAPTEIISLAEIFKVNTAEQYFPADGHYTISGNSKTCFR